VLGRLRNVGITLAEVIGQYHARGVVPLRRRPLRLYDMTADRPPWAGTVTALEPPSPLEVQRRVAQAIGRSTYSWPPSRMLPMLPNAGTEKFISCPSSRQVSFALCHGADLIRVDLGAFLTSQLKCAHLIPAKAPLPEEAIFNQNKAAAEKRRAAHQAQHKKCQIAKRDRNDNRTKRRKAGELGVSSDEDPSPKPSWSGDVASAVVDWSNMSGSSSSSLPRGAEVSSSCRPQATGRDKTVGSSSRQAAPPTRENQRKVRSHAAPNGTGASEPQRPAPRQADPPRRSEERPASARQLYDGLDHPDSDSLQRCRSRGRSSDSASTLSIATGGGAKRCPATLAIAAHPGRWSPRRSCVPCRQWGPWFNPNRRGGRGNSPRAHGGECCHR
jgi:hypothetical protein